jgi:pyruvate carboxylase
MASALLRNPKVNACVAERMRELSATQEEITMRLTQWIRADAADIMEVIKPSMNGAPAVVKVDRGPQVKAAEVLARINGMIVDKRQEERSGEVKVTIHYKDAAQIEQTTEKKKEESSAGLA